MKIFLKKFIPIIILISLFFVNQSMAANSSDLKNKLMLKSKSLMN